MKNIKIKSIELKNYCGYRQNYFDFVGSKGINNILCFYGPNGCGKSSLLYGINLISNAFQYENRETDLIFKRVTYNENYDSSSTLYRQEKGLEEKKYMELSAIFQTSDEGDKKVIINNNDGVVLNELGRISGALLFDTDSPSSLNKFQLPDNKLSSNFLEIAKEVYGFNCYFDFGENGSKIVTEGNINFITDFVIEKYGDKIHFNRMSAGEKKIAKLLESLCDYEYIKDFDIILIDNLDVHLYYKRHGRIISALTTLYPEKEFFISSHSLSMIDYIKNTYGSECLYDLEIYKLKELGLNEKTLIS